MYLTEMFRQQELKYAKDVEVTSTARGASRLHRYHRKTPTPAASSCSLYQRSGSSGAGRDGGIALPPRSPDLAQAL
jgi:hypothetical protein